MCHALAATDRLPGCYVAFGLADSACKCHSTSPFKKQLGAPRSFVGEGHLTRSTIVGAYPRIGSQHGDALRKELNSLYKGRGDPTLFKSLMNSLTRDIVHEMVSAGIDIPNYGLIDLHDEVTGHLEGKVEGISPDGIEKTFHTNIHFRRMQVIGEIKKTRSLVSDLYWEARNEHAETKIELTGPYTLGCHSILVGDCPYKNFQQLMKAYADLYREELMELKDVPWVQLDEPSIAAHGVSPRHVRMIRDAYRTMLEGVRIPIVVWTYYGKYSSGMLDLLLSLPNVKTVGLDFVWHPDVDQLLRKRLRSKPTDKGIGFGIIDCGDRGHIVIEKVEKVAQKLTILKNRLEGLFDFDSSFVSGNATFEHLPREIAQQKLRLTGEIAKRVSE